jgi:hypothetical protein
VKIWHSWTEGQLDRRLEFFELDGNSTLTIHDGGEVKSEGSRRLVGFWVTGDDGNCVLRRGNGQLCMLDAEVCPQSGGDIANRHWNGG